jgi:hypothetical protein
VKGTNLEQKLLDYELVEDLPETASAPEPESPEADMERAMATKERRPRARRKKK